MAWNRKPRTMQWRSQFTLWKNLWLTSDTPRSRVSKASTKISADNCRLLALQRREASPATAAVEEANITGNSDGNILNDPVMLIPDINKVWQIEEV